MLASFNANRVIEVWPENYASWAVFRSIDDQWLVGPGGAYALNHLVMHRELDDLGLTGEERERMKHDIREMARAALQAMRDT